MKVVGLITEYNPFHNGHKYHIEEAKRITGADYAIAVMSGNFVQRGAPAVIDKYSRTEMALQNGIDLVLELPVCYATGSAEFFAHGAVSLIDKLGIVDSLCFGSECGDIVLLEKAAQLLLNPPASFEKCLQTLLKDGMTYPAARLKALETSMNFQADMDRPALTKVLSEPNNILGIEYMKALHRLSSSITPVTIQRKAAHYHDKSLAISNTAQSTASLSVSTKASSVPDLELDDYIISSATAIRTAIHGNGSDALHLMETAGQSVPDDVYRFLTENYGKTYPITEEDFSQIIKYKILSEDSISLAKYMDVSSDLADRIKNTFDYSLSISKLTHKIKAKNMTMTRINRALIHILLNLQAETLREYSSHGYTAYARVLGLRKEASHLLRKIEQNARISILTKVSRADQQLEETGIRMLSEDIFATHLYNEAVCHKYGTILPNEYRHGICIL